jgi:hypothetical protein
MLKHNVANISFISDSLGQASLKTIESYLDSFGFDEKKKWVNKFLDI